MVNGFRRTLGEFLINLSNLMPLQTLIAYINYLHKLFIVYYLLILYFKMSIRILNFFAFLMITFFFRFLQQKDLKAKIVYYYLLINILLL